MDPEELERLLAKARAMGLGKASVPYLRALPSTYRSLAALGPMTGRFTGSLGDIAAASADPTPAPRVGRPRLTPEQIQRTASRQGTGVIGKTVKSIAPMMGAVSKVAGPVGALYSALESDPAVASTEVPPGGYFYESQAYPSMQADYAQPVLGEAGMMTGMDVAPDAGGAVGGGWADPPSLYPNQIGITPPAVERLPLSIENLAAADPNLQGITPMSMAKLPAYGRDIYGPVTETVVPSYPSMDATYPVTDPLVLFENKQQVLDSIGKIPGTPEATQAEIDVQTQVDTFSALPDFSSIDARTKAKIDADVAARLDDDLGMYAAVGHMIPSPSGQGWVPVYDPVEKQLIDWGEQIDKSRKGATVPGNPLSILEQVLGPIPYGGILAAVPRMITSPIRTIIQGAAGSTDVPAPAPQPTGPSAADIQRDKQAAIDTRKAEDARQAAINARMAIEMAARQKQQQEALAAEQARQVQAAQAASAAQAQAAQNAARAVLASAAGRDRGGPSEREINAAREVLSQIDTFDSGGMMTDTQRAMTDVGYGGGFASGRGDTGATGQGGWT